MTDNKLHLTIEVLRSRTIQYSVITVCILILMWFTRKWFIKPQCSMDDKPKPPLNKGQNL
jgi:hypothetical protein